MGDADAEVDDGGLGWGLEGVGGWAGDYGGGGEEGGGGGEG